MSGLASYTSLVSKYKQCDLDIFTLNQKIFALDEYMRRQLPELWLIRGCDTLLEECKRLIENHKEEENTLPEKNTWIIQAERDWKRSSVIRFVLFVDQRLKRAMRHTII